MTIAFSGIRLNEDPIDPSWDNYTLARELQSRAINAWGESEQALRDAQDLLGIEPKHKPHAAIIALSVLMEKHVEECALAGYFVGRYKIGAEAPSGGSQLLDPGKLPYTITDYLTREAFKVGRMHGLRVQTCAEGMNLIESLARLRTQMDKVINLRGDTQHGKINWTRYKIAQCLVWYADFMTLRKRAIDVYALAMEIEMGNHLIHHYKPDFYRTKYSSDDVTIYVKERSESFDLGAFLERKRKGELAARMSITSDFDNMKTLVEWKEDDATN